MGNVTRCQNCGMEQVLGAQFCPSCGQSLSGVQAMPDPFQNAGDTRRLIVHRIGILSYAKVSTVFAAIVGIPILLISLVVLLFIGDGTGFGLALLFGILYTLGHLVMVIIFILVLNFALQFVGGVELDVS